MGERAVFIVAALGWLGVCIQLELREVMHALKHLDRVPVPLLAPLALVVSVWGAVSTTRRPALGALLAVGAGVAVAALWVLAGVGRAFRH